MEKWPIRMTMSPKESGAEVEEESIPWGIHTFSEGSGEDKREAEVARPRVARCHSSEWERRSCWVLAVETPYSDLGRGNLRVVGTGCSVRSEERIGAFISKCLSIRKVVFVKLYVRLLDVSFWIWIYKAKIVEAFSLLGALFLSFDDCH